MFPLTSIKDRRGFARHGRMSLTGFAAASSERSRRDFSSAKPEKQ